MRPNFFDPFDAQVTFSWRGKRWAMARPAQVANDPASAAGRSFVSWRISEWCGDPAVWPLLLRFCERLTGFRCHSPARSAKGQVERLLRRALEQGDLVVFDPDALAPKYRAKEGVHGQRPKPTPPPAKPAPRVGPNSEELYSFAIRFVDQVGAPIPSVDLSFQYSGSKEAEKTDGNGVARLEDVPARTAVARVPDVKALRKAVKPKWDQAYGDRKKLDESQATIVVLKGDEIPSFDLVADKLRVVSLHPYVVRVRLLGGFFDTSKCFPLPVANSGFRDVVAHCERHPSPSLLVVGHTDSAGSAEYNDKLSLERAEAIKDFLTDNVDGWLKWYGAGIPVAKRWGGSEDGMMMLALADVSSKPSNEDTVRWFQRTRGLSVDGSAGPETRRALITEYMALPGTSLPKGVDVTPHGCGENFPSIDTGDGTRTTENRRVECFVFDRAFGVQPPPPGKNSGKGAQEYPEWCRRSVETDDHSHDFVRVRVAPRLESAFRYTLRVGSMAYEGSHGADGIIDHQVPADSSSGTLVVHLTKTQETYEWPLEIGDLDPAEDCIGMQKRLRNLGYYAGDPTGSVDEATEGALRLFQEDYDLAVTGEYDSATRSKLRSVHDDAAA